MIVRGLTTIALVLSLAFSPTGTLAADGKPDPTVVKDAHFGEVLFYFYQEEYFPAIVRLLAAQKQTQVENHLDESELLLGGLYLSYGHHKRAAEIFEKLLADNVESEIRNRTWFFLAKIWKQRGYLAEAQNALNNIDDELPKEFEAERHMLQAQLHIDNSKHDQAISVLQDWPRRDAWSNYAKFNLGVAMVRSGQVNAAASILDELGDMNPQSEEMSSLRDKANLALGYAYLRYEQPQAARLPLSRVRLEGPFSNKALLGMGWADAETNNYRRALVPWMELRDRDLLDSAVQESMLAVPYALAELDSLRQAADHYVDAIEAFREEAARIDAVIEKIQSGELMTEFAVGGEENTTGWHWKLTELPEGPESRYLYHLLATNKFQEGLKNFRDLHYLWQNLDEWQASVDVFRNMLSTREYAYNERLPVIEDSLANADLDGMVERKLDFDAQLKSIEESENALALATKREFELWGEIVAIERNSALDADIPEAAEVRSKVKLLKGALQWTLDKEFRARLSKIRRNLRQTGEALVETQRSRRQIAEKMRTEPLLFAEFNGRVENLSPQIDLLKSRVEAAMVAQRGFMEGTAVEELQAQRQRLDAYTVQARFSLAAIYDMSANETTVGDASQ